MKLKSTLQKEKEYLKEVVETFTFDMITLDYKIYFINYMLISILLWITVPSFSELITGLTKVYIPLLIIFIFLATPFLILTIPNIIIEIPKKFQKKLHKIFKFFQLLSESIIEGLSILLLSVSLVSILNRDEKGIVFIMCILGFLLAVKFFISGTKVHQAKLT